MTKRHYSVHSIGRGGWMSIPVNFCDSHFGYLLSGLTEGHGFKPNCENPPPYVGGYDSVISELTSWGERIDLERMSSKDPRVDAYIAKSADFAKPILIHLRKLAHAGCPGVEETLKWRMPHFLHQGILFGMAAFKQHCSIHFWKGEMVLGDKSRAGVFGNLGRVTALSDLPGKKELLAYIKRAVELNDNGVKKPVTARPKKKLIVPAYFLAALRKNKKAQVAFEKFSYSHKKEYLDWITEAKREETRDKRIETTIQWLALGKPRHWKYLNC